MAINKFQRSRLTFALSAKVAHIVVPSIYLYPRYEVYRGYIVFAFSVIMFVCLFVCLSVNFFFSSKISQQLLGLGF